MKAARTVKALALILAIVFAGCYNDRGSTDCCKDHDGVAMCYRPAGASHGHIMCRDGYTCREECY